jgi:RNA polymerase sigma-70 factor (ECF subfamily)
VDPTQEDFAHILASAQSGQEWAVARLYDALHPPLMRYLRWQEPAAADDLAGETWLAVAERIGRFSGGDGAFRAWFFAIARRRVADHRRRAARRRTVPLPDDVLALVPDDRDPAVTAVDELSSEQALALLTARLPPDQAEVVMLRVVVGLSVEETADVVSKRPGTVRVLQHRALRRLARELGRHSAVEV